MTGVVDALSPLAEWGVASRPAARETVSGDAHVMLPTANGFLAAVVDGLGHGPAAEDSAVRVTATLREHADEALTQLMWRCHQALRHTRGAVLSLVSVSAHSSAMTWLGVGNVEVNLFTAEPTGTQRREQLVLRGGVVGYQLPSLREQVLPIVHGDVLVLVTDGISSGFTARSPIGCAPQAYSDEILAGWAKSYDDALVLAVRYVGGWASAA